MEKSGFKLSVLFLFRFNSAMISKMNVSAREEGAINVTL